MKCKTSEKTNDAVTRINEGMPSSGTYLNLDIHVVGDTLAVVVLVGQGRHVHVVHVHPVQVLHVPMELDL